MVSLQETGIHILPRTTRDDYPPFALPKQKYIKVFSAYDIVKAENTYFTNHSTVSCLYPHYVKELITLLLSDLTHFDFNVEIDLVNEYIDEVFATALECLMNGCDTNSSGLFDRHLQNQYWSDSLYNLSVQVIWAVLHHMYHMGLANLTPTGRRDVWFDYTRGMFELSHNHIVYYLEGKRTP